MTYGQGEKAKTSLQESLSLVLGDDYIPPSPLREVAANRSVDELAPEDPVAAEMAQMRGTIDEIRKGMVSGGGRVSATTQATIDALRAVIERNLEYLDERDFEMMSGKGMSSAQNSWVRELRVQWGNLKAEEYQEQLVNKETSDSVPDEPPF